jgi:hypothetical protein
MTNEPITGAFFPTGHGGLPHPDLHAACRHIAAAYVEAPFLPELPAIGDAALHARAFASELIAEIGATTTRLRVGVSDAHAWIEEAPVNVHVGERFATVAPGAYPTAIHLPGPLTALGCATSAEGVRLWDVPQLRIAFARRTAREATAIARCATDAGHLPLVVLDEPCADALDAANPANLLLLETCVAPLREAGIAVGVHWCCKPPIDVLLGVDLDYASIDLVRYADVASARRRSLQRWLARGRTLVLGIVDATAPDDAETAANRVAAMGLPRDSAILLATSCGTSRMSVARESETAQLLRDAAGKLKARP